MAAYHELRLYDATGTLRAISISFEALSYTNVVNGTGVLEVTYLADDAAAAYLAINGRVDVVRWDTAAGIARTVDWTGLVRQMQWRREAADMVTARAVTLHDLLATRVVAWYQGTANRSVFTSVAAETICKTLVSYNAGSAATTANGRLRTGTISGLTVQTDGGGGNTLTWECAYANLLDTVQAVCRVGGGDFNLVRSGSNVEFRWYPGQMGTDRRSTVMFAVERGNMGEPVATLDYTEERTVALVGGKGEGTSRTVVVRTGAGYGSGADREMWVDAQNQDTTAGLNAAGDQRLAETQARREFAFRVLQTPGCLYGLHYGVGDLVRARWRGTDYDVKIESVQVAATRDGETVDVGVRVV